MAKLEEVEGKNAREYLKQINKRLADIEKRFNSTIKSRGAINGAFNARLQRLEKKGK